MGSRLRADDEPTMPERTERHRVGSAPGRLCSGAIVVLPKLSSLQPPARALARNGKTMSSSLLMTRRFAPLFWTQFFSAFSDNFLKNALVFLILFHIGGAGAPGLVTLPAPSFLAPFFFLFRRLGQVTAPLHATAWARR